ncbi:septum formation family protein [Dactylosporangium roseum]|uniref:Septum formation family protein n=1 Tax=Dactylosporangium roseum TaxID=47989 RepID=A0ABY5Z4L3_9ACTN|nr:septum formation family protein [Dactylosporangium roseum]UWZ36985.1 septum formation family protein [Dactylosporangium roseum]
MTSLRRLFPAVLPVVALMLLAACGVPAGVDKDLTDDWAMLAEPKVPSPPVGACYNTTVSYFAHDTTTIFSFKPVESCGTSHASETFFVGELTGSAANGSTPPKGAALNTAWSKCAKEAETFLGGDYHDGRLTLLVLAPSTAQWAGGARYFRCDLAEVASDGNKPVNRTSSLKDGLRGDKPVALTCAQETYESDGKTWLDYNATACTNVHNMEYVGTYTSGERPFPTNSEERRAAMRPGCEALGAKYLGMSASTLQNHQQLGIGFWLVDEEGWARGDRSARCYAMLFDKLTTVRSVKNLGNGKV